MGRREERRRCVGGSEKRMEEESQREQQRGTRKKTHHLSVSVETFMLMKVAPDSFARACAADTYQWNSLGGRKE
jgi:hypothetical protein